MEEKEPKIEKPETGEELEKLKERINLAETYEEYGKLHLKNHEDEIKIRNLFERVITNNELPKWFYKAKEDHGRGAVFSALELVGITKYYEKVAKFIKDVPKFISLKMDPYSDRVASRGGVFDGKPLLEEDDPFPDYTDEERLKLLKFGDPFDNDTRTDLTLSGMDLISACQTTRVSFESFKKGNRDREDFDQISSTIAHYIGHMALDFMNDSSKDIAEKAKKIGDLQAEEVDLYTKAIRVVHHTEEGNLEEIRREEEEKIEEIVKLSIDFAKEVIPEIRKRLAEEYERQKKK